MFLIPLNDTPDLPGPRRNHPPIIVMVLVSVIIVVFAITRFVPAIRNGHNSTTQSVKK